MPGCSPNSMFYRGVWLSIPEMSKSAEASKRKTIEQARLIGQVFQQVMF